MGLRGYMEILTYVLAIMISIYHYAETAISFPSIIANPSSKNMSLNGRASFSCSALHVVYIFWQVNYMSIDSIPDLADFYFFWQVNYMSIDSIPDLVDFYDFQTMGNVSTSKLEIRVHGLETNILNNSVITCVGYGLLEGDIVWFTNSSTPARLLIQG